MRLAFLACLVLALATISTHGEEQANQPTQQKQKGASSPQAQAAPSTAGPGVVGQPTTEAVNKGKAEKQTYLHHVLSPEILPNWLLFFVASIGIYFAWRTLRDLETQTSDFHIAALAAKKSADVAEQALQTSQRADILLNGASFRGGEVMNVKNWRLNVEFKNFGLTRAKNVQLSLSLIIEGVSVSPITQPPCLVGPSGTKALVFDDFYKVLPENLASEIFQGKLPLRFEAKATYEDVFGSLHTTNFSGVLQPHTGFFNLDKEEAD